MITHQRVLVAGRRKKSRLLRVVVSLAVLAVVAVGGISLFVGWKLTHPSRAPVDADPGQSGLSYDEIKFPNADGDVTLKGWFLPADGSNKTVILAHGYASNRLQPSLPALELARSLVNEGFNVLMFDFRNSGESGGEVTTLGYHEVKDLLGAVYWLRSERPDAAGGIGVIGSSMGAVTAILAAAQQPAIAAVVLDSPFADLRTYLKDNMTVWTGLPDVPFTWTIMTIMPPLLGLDLDAVSPISVIPHIRQPVLLIHTDRDNLIPAGNSEALAAAGRPDRTELWLVPGERHVGARQVDPETYDQKLADFFRRHLRD